MTRWRAVLFGMALWVAVTGTCVLGEGCAAPTLPIPPPTALVSSPDASGFVTVSGMASADAYIFVLDEERQAGIIGHADPTGNYSLRIQAAIGETITVWQMIGSQAGEQAHVVVR